MAEGNSSKFTALVMGRLDTSEIEKQVKNLVVEGGNITLKNFGVDSGSLATTIQDSLKKNKFKITLGEVKIDNLESTAKGISKSLAGKASLALDSGKITAEIAKVNAAYEKIGASGHAGLPAIKSDIEQLKSLRSEMIACNQVADNSGLSQSYEKFLDVLNRVKNSITTVRSENQAMASALDMMKLDNRMTNWLEKNKGAATELRQEVEALQAKLRETMDSGSAVPRSTFDSYKNAFNVLEQINPKPQLSVWDQLVNKTKQFATSLMTWYAAVNVLRSMYQNVLDIDTQMTELKKVTDETSDTYSKFMKNASSSAKEIGTTISGLISSTADFARLGYNFGDAQELAKVANIYTVVGDEIGSVDDATKSIISTMAAFGIQANEAISIVDKFNEVGNNFAISSGGIGEALTRSGSSLAAANNSIDQSIALITAANTVVQNPEVIGTAFKTMSMRLRAAESEMEAAGLETEGMINSVSKLRSEILALSGVDIMINDNTFKSTYDILDELSRKWENFSDVTQANLTEILAGKRMGNVVSSLMTNFDVARQAYETSAQSAGSAMKEHETWLGSLEAKVMQLKAAWQGLSQAFMESDAIKGLISAGTKLIEVFEGIVRTVGSMPVAFSLLAVVLTKVFDGFNLFKSLNLGSVFNTIIQAVTKAISSLTGLNIAFKALGDGAGLAGKSLFSVNGLIAAGLGLAITGAINLIMKFVNANKKLHEEVMDTVQDFENQQQSVTKAKSAIDELGSEYAKLSMGVNELNGNMNLSDEEYRRYLDICNQLGEAMPSLIQGYDSQGNAILSVKGSVEGLTQAYNELQAAASTPMLADASKIFKDFQNQSESLGGMNTTKKALEGLLNSADIDQAIADLWESNPQVYTEIIKGLRSAGLQADKTKDASSQAFLKRTLQENKTIVQSIVTDWNNQINEGSKGMKNLLDAYVNSSLAGSNMTQGVKDILKQSLNNVDFDFFSNFGSANDMYSYLNNLISDFSSLSGKDSNTLTIGVDTQTMFNNGQVSLGQYLDQMAAIDKLTVGMDEETQARISLIFNNEDYQEKFDQMTTGGSKDLREYLLSLSKEDFNVAFDLMMTGDFNSIKNNTDALEEFKETVKTMSGELNDLDFEVNVSTEIEGMDKLYEAMKQSYTATGLTGESLSELQQRYADFDSSGLFENTANGIHLNAKALRELESEYEKQQKIKFDEKLDSLSVEYNNLTEKINSCTDAQERASLYSQRQDIQTQIDGVVQLAAQYDGLTSAFNRWQEAQSIGEEGDMYDSIVSGLDNVKELYDEGLVGTEKFRSFVDLMSDQDVSGMSTEELVAAYEESYPVMMRYFTDGQDGCQRFVDDLNAMNEEWAHINEEGKWELNFDDEEVAEALNIDVEAVQAVMRKLKDFGWDIDLSSLHEDLDLTLTKLEEANQKLIEMGETEIEFNFSSDNMEELDTQIAQARELLDQFRGENGVIDFTIEGASEAQDILNGLIERKAYLSQPEIMSIDTSALAETDAELSEAIELLQQLSTITVNLESGGDVSDLSSQISNVKTQIDELPSEVKTKLGVDDSEFQTALSNLSAPDVSVKVKAESLETVKNTLAGINSKTVTLLADGSKAQSTITKVDSMKIGDKSFNITAFDNASSAIDKISAKLGTIHDKSVAVTVHVNQVGKSKYLGTAFAQGNWGIDGSGIALGGELGQELVVRNGHYFTIGDAGAEFFKYQQGDIIFNAAQTAALFRLGNTYSRGRAFSSGSGHFWGGGGSSGSSGGSGGGYSSSSSYGGSTSSSTSSSPSSSSSTSTKSSSTTETQKEPEVLDWIEVAIDRINEAIDRLKVSADSAYNTLKTRLSSTYDEINKVNKELSIQSAGYTRYMQQANSVGLPASLAKRVQDGTIDITEYDEATADMIKDYQKWYEKALDCSDAIQELHEDLAQLYEDNFENIEKDFDNQLDLLDHLTSTYETGLDSLEASGYMASTKYYGALQNVQRQNISTLQKELNALTDSFQEAMNSGEVATYSESWYEYQKSINDVKEALADANVQLKEYQKAMRELEWEYFDKVEERITGITDEAEFLLDLLGNKKMFNDKGEFTNEGLTALGLHAQNYNVDMAQADQYAEEMANINAQLARDPNNQDLIDRRRELLELQQKSILAAEKEKKAISDLVKDGIEIELDAVKELITGMKDSLSNAKSLYDYQKKLAEQADKVASLQKQLTAYSGDDSEEARATTQKLQSQLEEAQEDLNETEYNRYISDTKDLLDELYNNYEAVLNARLDNLDALVAEMITVVNDNAYLINDTLRQVSTEVGYTMTEEMQNIWGSSGQFTSVVTMYGNSFLDKLTTINSVLNGIQLNTQNMIKASDNLANQLLASASATTSAREVSQRNTTPTQTPTSSKGASRGYSSGGSYASSYGSSSSSSGSGSYSSGNGSASYGSGSRIYAGSALIYEYAGGSGYHQYYANDPVYTVLREQNGFVQVRWHNLSSGITGWFRKSDIKPYKTGGFVNYTGLAQVHGSSNKPEMFLSASDTENFVNLTEALRDVAKPSTIGKYPSLGGVSMRDGMDMSGVLQDILVARGQSGINVDQDINIDIDHVENYEDFMNKIRSDPKFRNMVLDMTINEVAGGSSLANRKYNW